MDRCKEWVTPVEDTLNVAKALAPRQTKWSRYQAEGGMLELEPDSVRVSDKWVEVKYMLTSELRAQSSIIVEGVVIDDPKWFQVEFWVDAKKGRSSSKNDALDFSVKFKPRHVELSSYSLYKYLGETTEVDAEFPFRPGQPFYLEFHITEEKFKIAVNGWSYVYYKHKLPFKSINKIQIFGDINLTNVQYEKYAKFPTQLPKGVWIREEDYNEEQHGEIIIKDANVPVPEPAWSSAI
ncbi:galectin-8-like [Macrosteles quadrilineatus]|uniref:galectin-8-like n=1 Tax=Macrosteles quadrilineatus TaxID=74068 RepID=UPI0023E1A54B|nr:galectin-8-like [Macrosteles quadrilineatus]